MGKRKQKAHNVVKVNLGEYAFKETGTLPVVVQHSSKDGRRIEQTIHQVPMSQPNPPPLRFDPRPVVEEVEEDEAAFLGFFNVEPPSGGNGGDRVRSHFSLFSFVSDPHLDCSWIRFGYGVENATFSFKILCGWKDVWNSAMACATFV